MLRFSAGVKAAFGLFSIVMVAGCSNTQGSRALLPGVVLPDSHAAKNGGAIVALWVASQSQSYIYGQDERGKRTVMALDVGANGCMGPQGIKVDHQRRLWVACSDGQYGPGTVQVYKPGRNSPSKTYTAAGRCGTMMKIRFAKPPHCRECGCSWEAALDDVAFDGEGNVFAAETFECTHDGGINCGANFDVLWWNSRSSKAGSIYSTASAESFFLDIDVAGNLYVGAASRCTYSQYVCTEDSIDEITGPTSISPVVTTIIPAGSDELGGVYVSNGGGVLNVVDETARTASQYRLPWVTSEMPFNVLGPTLTRMGEGRPISGGFDADDDHLALGDADGWADIGNVARNNWSAVTNKNLKYGNGGAAYVPSDK